VDFPVAEVSRHSAREKSIRHGHPSTLHLWWARRPLAACRAMLMALLLPDPCDEHCPAEFKAQARRLLAPVPMVPLGPEDADLRKALLKFIADFANWDNSANQTYLMCARSLLRAAHGEEPPLVVDPFAGGGSIPLEALRVGCDAFASDLNPVACLILKVLLEDIPRHGPGLADELRRVGKEIKAAAEKELAEFYPADPDGARPIAHLWARTVRCESPKCGAEIPLVRSFWLCKKANRRRALRPKVVRPKRGTPQIEFEIFEPKGDRDVPAGTVSRAKATCLACSTVLSPDRVRAQLSGQRGGADASFGENGQRIGGALMLAVVTLSDEQKGRAYRLPFARDYEAIRRAEQCVSEILKAWRRLPAEERGLCPIPDEPTPAGGGSGAGRAFSVQKYGMVQWGDLFTARQKLALTTIARLVSGWDCSPGVKDLLGLVMDRVCSRSSSLCLWRYHADQEKVEHIFGRQALPVVWDFAEAAVLSESTGSFSDGMDVVAQCVGGITAQFQTPGQVGQADACSSPLANDSAAVWFTDPPYYDAVPYADLSDFFFVWLRRALPGHPALRNPFEAGNTLTPKCPEIVQDETKKTPNGRPKDKVYFEEAMQLAFTEGRRVLLEDGVGSVVFAHKTTEGWEALLSGMLKGGWTVTASWPITTEMANRLRARESAALAASVHLVCRPRAQEGIGGWEDILRELPNRIGDWMERLSSEGIRGADLVFSCIGPALELFSKYDKVETAEGREVKLDEFLEKVWEVVGRAALQQVLGTAEARARNGAAAALEEDARLTALFLWTLQSTDGNQKAKSAAKEEKQDEDTDEDEEETGDRKAKKGYTLIYDVVRRFAQPLGIHLENWDGRIIEVKKGVVRLLPVLEREERLFGTSGTAAVARTLERTGGRDPQYMLFPEQPERHTARKRKAHRGQVREESEALASRREATTLDRVHAAILLQARGEATALRALLQAEAERSPDFLRLANALSALYPKDSEEKRLLDAMLLAVPRG
jgi:putative DNA methylase